MPFITTLPPGFVTINVETGVIDIGETSVLGGLPDSREFEFYNPEGGLGAATVESGETLAVEGGDLASPISGTFAGSGSFSTAATSLLGGAASIQVNPVSGHFILGDGGQVYFVSDEPLAGNNIGVTLDSFLTGEVNVPLSELGQVPLIGTLLDPALGAVNDTLNEAVITTVSDPTATLAIPADLVSCFVKGTLIETDRGSVLIEDLRVGDLVQTRDNGLQPIAWIGSTAVKAKQLALMPNLQPIRISAGALGKGMPSADLVVSPQHRVLVRSAVAQKMFGAMEVLVAAKQLLQVQGIDIAHDLAEVEYFHFMFDNHEVVTSNGAATESLFTGPEAIKAVGRAAREEIFALFPQLLDEDYVPQGARFLPKNRMARKLVSRHLQHRKPMVAAH